MQKVVKSSKAHKVRQLKRSFSGLLCSKYCALSHAMMLLIQRCFAFLLRRCKASNQLERWGITCCCFFKLNDDIHLRCSFDSSMSAQCTAALLFGNVPTLTSKSIMTKKRERKSVSYLLICCCLSVSCSNWSCCLAVKPFIKVFFDEFFPTLTRTRAYSGSNSTILGKMVVESIPGMFLLLNQCLCSNL